MTLYARGYRPYEGERKASTRGFATIQREGYRLAVRGRSFWILFILVLVAFLILGVMLYVNSSALNPRRWRGEEGTSVASAAAAVAVEGAVWILQSWSTILAQVLVLLVGAGLVADDLKTRALPLYLVRPITPVDYWLGKILIPIRVLTITVLVPGLALILLGALYLPSEEMRDFLWDRKSLALGVVLHFTVLALSFSSLALLVSTWVGRRGGAIALGAVILFAGGIPGGMAAFAPEPFSDLLRSTHLGGNAQAVLVPFLSSGFVRGAGRHLPPVWSALAVSGGVFLLGFWTVVRRARSAETSA